MWMIREPVRTSRRCGDDQALPDMGRSETVDDGLPSIIDALYFGKLAPNAATGQMPGTESCVLIRRSMRRPARSVEPLNDRKGSGPTVCSVCDELRSPDPRVEIRQYIRAAPVDRRQSAAKAANVISVIVIPGCSCELVGGEKQSSRVGRRM